MRLLVFVVVVVFFFVFCGVFLCVFFWAECSLLKSFPSSSRGELAALLKKSALAAAMRVCATVIGPLVFSSCHVPQTAL